MRGRRPITVLIPGQVWQATRRTTTRGANRRLDDGARTVLAVYPATLTAEASVQYRRTDGQVVTSSRIGMLSWILRTGAVATDAEGLRDAG